MNRRNFLKASVMAAAAIAGTPLAVESKPEKARIERYREIGKTGLKMSDISCGTGKLPSTSMIHA